MEIFGSRQATDVVLINGEKSRIVKRILNIGRQTFELTKDDVDQLKKVVEHIG